MMNATVQPVAMQPLAIWNPQRGVWETTQPDLFGLKAPSLGIWPTGGMTQDGSACRLPLSALLATATASSSSPPGAPLFRTPLASGSSRGGEAVDQVRARRGTSAPVASSDRRLGSSGRGLISCGCEFS